MSLLRLSSCLAAVWLAARLAERRRYRDAGEVAASLVRGAHPPLTRSGDAWFEGAAFVATWCELALALVAATRWPLLWPVSALVVAGRFRVLQEIGHTALHLGFGPDKALQRRVADWLGNYPTWKADSERRFQSHCVEHHPQAAAEADPNTVRLRRVGVVPGISAARFAVLLVHPLTPEGVFETLSTYATNARGALVTRLVVNAAVLGAAWRLGGWRTLSAYLVALLLVYPLYSWWSLLLEHRWFPQEESRRYSRLEYECLVGRRTVYGRAIAWFMRGFVCPLTDCYHLAHHLYPRVHWRYIAHVDRALAAANAAYANNAAYGVFFPANGAMRDLYHRLVKGGPRAARVESNA